MTNLMVSLLLVAASVTLSQSLDVSSASYDACDEKRGKFSVNVENGFVPGLFIATSNIPGAMQNSDGSLASRKIVCAHQDSRTSGGSVVIPWAQFDKRDEKGGGYFDWDFVDQQMEPWVSRGQVVNLLVWPAVQKKDQLFPEGASATPDYIFNTTGMTYQCPDGTAQGHSSEGIPLPMFWLPGVYERYAQALKQLVKRYENHPNVNYFRFGIGVGAESYPGNGATVHNNYCMSTFVTQFGGATYEEKARNAYNTWYNYVVGRVRAFRRFKSTKPIVVTINDFATLSSIDEKKFPNMIAEEATRDYVVDGVEYPKLGIGVQGATTQDIELHNRGEPCYADWCKIFLESESYDIPLQVQTPLHSGVNGRPGPWQTMTECQEERQNNGRYGCTNTGNMAELIHFSLSLGANVFELYSYEWFVANDNQGFEKPPDLNWHAMYGQEYSDALDLASNEQLVPVAENNVDETEEEPAPPPTGTRPPSPAPTGVPSPPPTISSATTRTASVAILTAFVFVVFI